MSDPNDTTAATPSAATPAPRVDGRLLELLVCPMTKQPLVYDAARQELVSRAARLAYPIRDGVPVMLAEEARTLADDDPHLKPAR
jgi:uncharacterized protein